MNQSWLIMFENPRSPVKLAVMLISRLSVIIHRGLISLIKYECQH